LKDLKNELKVQKDLLEKLESSIKVKEADFLITKLTTKEQQIIDEKVGQITTECIQEFQSTDKENEIKRLKTILDPEGAFASINMDGSEKAEEINEMRNSVLELITNQILLAEGKDEDWATNIEENDPALDLTTSQLEYLKIDDRASPDEQAEFTLNLPKLRESLKDERRKVVIEERLAEIEKRKKELSKKSFEALLEVVFNYKILSQAHAKGMDFHNDMCIYYAVKKKDSPIYKTISGDKVIDTYERFFKSVEQVEYLREKFEAFYEWLLANYRALQIVRSREDLERIARSNLFRGDL
jgi:hypothetical protein